MPNPETSATRIHLWSLRFLYLLTIVAVAYYSISGWAYYRLPMADRPHAPQYTALKPGGIVGHGLGVIGSALMLLLLLYSIRKRSRAMHRWGDIRWWLNYHIWMGVTGPLLVILHTSFKFSGIIAISFWSMIAVALSGALGRYIYIQVPRGLGGQEMTGQELEAQRREMLERLKTQQGVSEKSWQLIEQNLAIGDGKHGGGWGSIWQWITADLVLSKRMSRMRQSLGADSNISRSEINEIVKLTRQLAILQRRVAFMEQAQALLHHWHIIHRPFALVMIVIMMVHTAVAVVFGYRWIF